MRRINIKGNFVNAQYYAGSNLDTLAYKENIYCSADASAVQATGTTTFGLASTLLINIHNFLMALVCVLMNVSLCAGFPDEILHAVNILHRDMRDHFFTSQLEFFENKGSLFKNLHKFLEFSAIFSQKFEKSVFKFDLKLNAS